MNLRDYQWFQNPRGLRNNGPYLAIRPERYLNPRMGWARLVAGGTEHLDTVRALVAQRCMPIVSFYRERMGAAPAPNAWHDLYLQYIDAGALWFELYEEPNTPSFWPLGADGALAVEPNWETQACVQPLMDNWLAWAENMIKLGGYPAFPALAETTEPALATVKWLEICLLYLKETAAERFVKVAAEGLWAATHPFVMNHFYQEPPGGPAHAQRPQYQQSASEEGWRFEYPYDPAQQREDPGRGPFGGTEQTPHGDPNGLVAAGEAFQELLRRTFNVGPIPVVGTAGGIHPIPAPGADPIQQDARYLPYTRDSHAEATLAMFQWIARHGPPWLFGLTLSTEADYYDASGTVPAIDRLAKTPPILKELPDVDTAQGVAMSAAPEPPPAPEPAPEPAPSAPEIETVNALPLPPVEPEPPPTPEPAPEPAPSAPEIETGNALPLPPVEPEPPPTPEPPAEPPLMLPVTPLPQLLQEPPPAPEPKPIPLPPVSPPRPAAPEPEPALTTPAPRSAGPLGPGPGPLKGAPDYHWLLPAPDLPADWLWDSAWRYWDAFRLTIIPSADLIGAVPPESSLALTIIAPPASLESIRQDVTSRFPNVKLDAVAAQSLEALQAEMDRRADSDSEYG